MNNLSDSSSAIDVKKNDITKLMEDLSELSERNASGSQVIVASIEAQTSGIEQTASTSENLTSFAIELNASILKF